MEKTKTQYGINLLAYRNENKISRPKLAKQTGVTVRKIEKWEWGISEPRYCDAKAVADYIGVPLSSLCGYDVSAAEEFFSIRDFILWNMREHGITNKEKFAKTIGITAPTMYKFVKGKTEPKINNVVDMLKEFGYYGTEKSV